MVSEEWLCDWKGNSFDTEVNSTGTKCNNIQAMDYVLVEFHTLVLYVFLHQHPLSINTEKKGANSMTLNKETVPY